MRAFGPPAAGLTVGVLLGQVLIHTPGQYTTLVGVVILVGLTGLGIYVTRLVRRTPNR